MGQLRHLGHWDRGGPRPVIRFTADHVANRDTLAIERLLPVYQCDANVVAGEGEVHIFAGGPVAAARQFYEQFRH